MAEPFAAGVLNSLLQPRVPLARVTRSKTAHSTLAANFFTPLPRQTKQKARAANASPAVGHTHILECQAWAYPLGKEALWGHGALAWFRSPHGVYGLTHICWHA
jgi:hypothetical protein